MLYNQYHVDRKEKVLGGGSPLGEGVAENREAGCSEGKAFPSFLFI